MGREGGRGRFARKREDYEIPYGPRLRRTIDHCKLASTGITIALDTDLIHRCPPVVAADSNQTGIGIDRQIDKQANRQTHQQTDRQTVRQTDIPTDRKSDTETDSHRQSCR